MEKKIPMRTCVACRSEKPKRELIRVVKLGEEIKLDLTGKANGRGAYVCNDKACIVKLKKSKATRVLSYFKYVVLIALVVVLPILFAVPGFCEFICPAGTLEGGVGLLSNPQNAGSLGMLGPLFSWKFTLLIIIEVASIFIYRVFCRFLCPLGALYGFFCRIALLGVKLDKEKCTDCGLCIGVCKMDIKRVGDHECISCGACISVCPTKAISWKGAKLLVRGNDTDAPTVSETKPLNGLLQSKETPQKEDGENADA